MDVAPEPQAADLEDVSLLILVSSSVQLADEEFGFHAVKSFLDVTLRVL